MSKYAMALETIFDFSYLDYTQRKDTSKVNTGCGNLQYIPHLWTDPFDMRSNLIFKLGTDYVQEEGLRFHVDAPGDVYIGIYDFIVEVHSDVMLMEPHYNFIVRIEILPCFVRETNLHDQRIDDFELTLFS